MDGAAGGLRCHPPPGSRHRPSDGVVAGVAPAATQIDKSVFLSQKLAASDKGHIKSSANALASYAVGSPGILTTFDRAAASAGTQGQR